MSFDRFEHKDLAALVEALASEARNLKTQVTELEREQSGLVALAAENSRLKRDYDELRARVVEAVACGARLAESRHPGRLLEIYRQDLERFRLLRASKPGAD